MIAMKKARYIGGKQHYALEIDQEGAAYLADVLEEHQYYDAGAMEIVRQVRSALPGEQEEEEPDGHQQ